MRVLCPVGDKMVRTGKRELAPRLDTLTGKVIGIIDDGAGKTYFERVEKLLNEQIKPAQIIHKIKPHLSQPSPPALLEEMVKNVNAVIVGIGI